jgi:hypothetical protein
MIGRSELRKEAYKYILEIITQLPSANNKNYIQSISLEELRLIRDGIEDPSPSLIASIKELFNGTISTAEIDSHLVIPFERNNIQNS